MVPNLLASSCCPSASTLAQKCPARSISGQVDEVRLGQNSTSGGASDSAANAWQANPAGPCGPVVVMTVTPVQKWPRTCRNSAVPGQPGGAKLWPQRLTAVLSRLIQLASSTSRPSVPYSMSKPPGVRT